MWRSRALLLLAAATALQLAGPVTAAPACPPGLGVGLVDVPKDSRDPRAQNYIVDHVAPGSRFARRFQVCNGTTKPITVQLYAGAAAIDGGGFRVIEGRATNEVSSWIAIDPPRVTVAPGQRVLARATFAVPREAESGERYGVLLAELPPTAAGNVGVASRVGVRVYLDVGPGGAPRSDFVVDSLQAARDDKGNPLVNAAVRNTGLRALDVTGAMTLAEGPGGLTGGPYAATIGTTLAPGQTEPVLVKVDRAVAAGPWTATLTLRSGLLERRVKGSLTFPDASGAEAVPVDVEQLPTATNEVINPLPALAAGGLLLAVVVGLVVRRRRISRREPAPPAP